MLSICQLACQERELYYWLHFFIIQFEFRFIPHAAFVNDYLVQFCFIILNINTLFFVYLLINNMLFSVVRNVSQYCPFNHCLCHTDFIFFFSFHDIRWIEIHVAVKVHKWISQKMVRYLKQKSLVFKYV